MQTGNMYESDMLKGHIQPIGGKKQSE